VIELFSLYPDISPLTKKWFSQEKMAIAKENVLSRFKMSED
jgi:hypothetical protein